MSIRILLAALAVAVVALAVLGRRHRQLRRDADEADVLTAALSDANAARSDDINQLAATNRDLRDTLADLEARLARVTGERDAAVRSVKTTGATTVRLLQELHAERAEHTASLASITTTLTTALPARAALPRMSARVPQALPSGDFLVADDKGPLILQGDHFDFLKPEPAQVKR